MKNILTLFISCLLCGYSFSQAVFLKSARIEFERKINIRATLKGTFAKNLKEKTPQYRTDYFDFVYGDNKSLYQPVKSRGVAASFLTSVPAGENIVYTDFKSGKYIAQKNIYENTYLVEDQLRKATWKITNDFREIAGFHCRRATTILLDSVFVVAFYAEELMISGGPESINGLPGMILGLVINRLHTTWYATKVSVSKVQPGLITPPVKGIKVNHSEVLEQVLPTFSKWGVDAAMALLSVMI